MGSCTPGRVEDGRKMRKRTMSLALVLLLVLVGVLVALGAAAPRPAFLRLGTPILVSPRNGATFNSGQEFLFEWRAVPGADHYRVELQIATNIDKKSVSWAPFTSFDWWDTSKLVMFQFGPKYMRWRVTAISTDSLLNSYPSKWRTFTILAP